MKISAVIDAYNSEDYITEAIESVLSQSRLPDELIIVDDGSTDGTFDRIQEAIEGHSIAVAVQQANQGQLGCLTSGIMLAKGDLIALLDGDDIWKKNHLKEAEEAFEKFPKLSLYFCDYETIGEDRKGVTRYPDTLFNSTFAVTALSEAFIGNVTATLVFKASVLQPHLPFPKQLERDWVINADNPLIWLSCLSGRQKYSSSQKNVRYRMHDNNMHKVSKESQAKAIKRIATKRLFEFFRREFYISDDIYKCLIREYKAQPTKSKEVQKAYIKAIKNSLAHAFTKISLYLQIKFN